MFLDLAVLPAGLQLEEGTINIKGLRINKDHNNIAIINICMFGGGGVLFSIFLFILIAEIFFVGIECVALILSFVYIIWIVFQKH